MSDPVITPPITPGELLEDILPPPPTAEEGLENFPEPITIPSADHTPLG
jgi:hypothetical protein